MASPLSFPKFRAFNSTGTGPLAGGLLYTYIAGTSTPQNTYTSSTLGTANANPVVLDSTGSADVWLGNASYKFILQDSLAVVQWTEDNVSQSGWIGFRQGCGVANMSGASAIDSTVTNIGLTAQSPTVSPNPLGEFSTTAGTFTAAFDGTYHADVMVNFNVTGATLRTTVYPKIFLIMAGVTYSTLLGAANAGSTPSTTGHISQLFTLSAGNTIIGQYQVGFSAGAPTFTYTMNVFRVY